jgi:hypothetical protein
MGKAAEQDDTGDYEADGQNAPSDEKAHGSTASAN